MAVMQTPTASEVMMVVITISNGDDVDADRERGEDGGDHYQQPKWWKRRQRAW
jgi:hypothetical protein